MLFVIVFYQSASSYQQLNNRCLNTTASQVCWGIILTYSLNIISLFSRNILDFFDHENNGSKGCTYPESLCDACYSKFLLCSCAEEGSESFSIIVSNEHIESDDTDQDKHLLYPSGAGEVTTIKETHR